MQGTFGSRLMPYAMWANRAMQGQEMLQGTPLAAAGRHSRSDVAKPWEPALPWALRAFAPRSITAAVPGPFEGPAPFDTLLQDQIQRQKAAQLRRLVGSQRTEPMPESLEIGSPRLGKSGGAARVPSPLAGWAQDGSRDHGLPSALRDVAGGAMRSASLHDPEDLGAPEAANNGPGQDAQVAALRQFLQWLLRGRRAPGRRPQDERTPQRSASEVAEAAFETAIRLTKERFAESGKPKVEIELSELGAEDSRTAIEQFARAHLDGRLIDDPKRQTAQLNLGRIGEENAERLLSELGIDVSSFHRSIDTKHLNHAFRRHGPDNEGDPHQVPISPEAVAMYLDVANDPDSEIVFRRGGRSKPATIRYSKRVDGYLVFVEEIRTGRHTLAFKTMWITKAK